MELYLAAAAAFLLPLLLQCWLLSLGRRRPKLRFTRWLPLLGSAVFAALALSAAGENGVFRGLAVLAYGAALILLGWACGWGADALRRRIARGREKTP
mgnify:CR=1 FL=1